MTTDVVGCARCGCDHKALTFALLTRPLEFNGAVLTHWAPCPTTGAPILLRVESPVPSTQKPQP